MARKPSHQKESKKLNKKEGSALFFIPVHLPYFLKYYFCKTAYMDR